MKAVASKKTHNICGLRSLVLSAMLAIVAVFAAACSSSGTAEPSATPETSETAAPSNNEASDDTQESTANGAANSDSGDSDSGDSDSGDQDGSGASTSGDTTQTSEPTLRDADLASVQDLDAGEQVEDAQGNLIAIYGVAVWPESFEMLSDTTQAEFPFFGDVEAVANPASQLVVLDVGMCAAGLDASGFGTAEFFVHESPTEALSVNSELGRGVLARHPVALPGFGFPAPAECERGFLPVLWDSASEPAVARYVLVTRPSATDDVERHVYQWDLAPVQLDSPADANDSEQQFAVGQTVTFNEGRLQDTTVLVNGWAELIGSESPIVGTRLVAVSLDYCPSSTRLPEFGIGVDNWNIVAPLEGGTLGAAEAEDPSTACFDGWLEFAVPFGSVPTAFFASDGLNATVGYAEWSLANAALAAPES